MNRTFTLTDAEYEILKKGLTIAIGVYTEEMAKIQDCGTKRFRVLQYESDFLWSVSDKIKTGGLFS